MRKLHSYIKKYGVDAGTKLYTTLQKEAIYAFISRLGVFEQGDWRSIWGWIYGGSVGGQAETEVLKFTWTVRKSDQKHNC